MFEALTKLTWKSNFTTLRISICRTFSTLSCSQHPVDRVFYEAKENQASVCAFEPELSSNVKKFRPKPYKCPCSRDFSA
jgi:hypothetical protein